MKRRDFVKRTSQLSLAALSATSILSGQAACSTPGSRKPNIIYILADDLGYGDLSCFGQSKFQTPHLDRMAGEGIKLTDHYSGSTVCAPARCCLMTGFHTGHARVRGNWEKGPQGWGAGLELRSEDITVAEILKNAGYRTGGFGKWSLGVAATSGAPWKKGFDQWFGYLNQGEAHFYYPQTLDQNDRKMPLPGNREGGRKEYAPDLISDKLLDFIEQNRENPFFAYWAITIPHAELLVPEESLKPFLSLYDEKSYVGKHYASQPAPRAAFAGMVTRMDRDIGRLFAKLKELGIDDNTAVFFSSDNGPHREGGHDPAYFNSSGSLRGIKRDLYEGGIRVPTIARWPGRIHPGSQSSHISAFWDFLPTACEIAGVNSPEGIDGISFLPALEGNKQQKHEYLYWEFHEKKASAQAIRMGKWKAVRHSPLGPIELYDLNRDTGEQTDVALQYPEVLKLVVNALSKARTPHEIWRLKS